MKKRFLACTILAMATLFASMAAYAQQTAPPRYGSALYLHVPQDKDAQFVEFYKSGNGMKAAHARMKADANITGISVRRVVFANPIPRANFVILTQRNGAPVDADPAKRDELYRAATGMNYAGFIAQARTTSELVGTTMTHLHDSTNIQLSEGDVIVARRLKTAEGKLTDLSTLMHTIRLPIMTEHVKAGDMKGWAFSHLAMAGGSALPYDATETRIYKDIASALGGGGPGNNTAAMALFTKLFPDRNYTRYLDDSRDLAKLIRTETSRVVVAFRP